MAPEPFLQSLPALPPANSCGCAGGSAPAALKPCSVQVGSQILPARAGSVLTSLAPLQELRRLQQDLDVAGHGLHVGDSRRRAGRGCWPWRPRNHFCFNVTDTVPQTEGPPRPRPPRPGPAPGNRGRPALPRPSRLLPPSLSQSAAPAPGDKRSAGPDSLDAGRCELPTLLPPAVARAWVARARGRRHIHGAGREPPRQGWLARGPALSRRGAPARAGKAAGFKFENPDDEGGGERRRRAMRTRLRRGAGAGHGAVCPASAPRGSSRGFSFHR